MLLLSFLVVAFICLRCYGQPSEVCSLRRLLKELVVTHIFADIDLNNNVDEDQAATVSPGALLTVWGGPIPDSYHCQVDSHRRYALRHGYTHYVMNDTAALNWQEHANSGPDIDIYWFKLLALLHVLKLEPKHPWVLYVDMDDIFEDEHPGRDSSIEGHLKTIVNYKDVHAIFPDKRGWSTDFIFAKNSPMGVKFIEHFWSLRHFCPGCVGEQCAGHIAMLETLLFGVHALIARGESIEDEYTINRDHDGQFSCCNPKSHCRWPHGPKGNINGQHGNQVQGCVWNWEAALNFTGEYPNRREYPYIKLSSDFRSHIGVHHWYKKENDCIEALEKSKVDQDFQWKEWRMRV